MSKPFTYRPSPFLAEKRIGIHRHLQEQARTFLEVYAPPTLFADPEVHSTLSNVLEREGLVQFNRTLRAAVTQLRPGVDSSPFWALIDATGFWEDTTPGRWRYMTEERAEVLLGWCASYIAGQLSLADESSVA